MNGLCLYGRTWEDFISFLERIKKVLFVSEELQLIIYVHNLSYEFQFMRYWFEWKEIFARTERKPIKALTTDGFCFKCSYILSGYSLSKVADNLTKYKIKKLTEIMDYDKIRTPLTPLTNEELSYSLNDIKIVEYYIREQIELNNNDITQIPLTQTSYIRRKMKENCYNKKDRNNRDRFFKTIHSLNIDDEEYLLLKRAFQGGFTHANAWYNGDVLKDVSSIDFSSSYPAVIVNEQFPMSSGIKIQPKSKEEFYDYIEKYCCIFDIEFRDLEEKHIADHPLSYSKCWDIENEIVDNGRIVSATKALTTMTEVDFEYFEKFYDWNDFTIGNFYYYEKNYLPKQIIETTLSLYAEKTKLKGLDDYKAEYLHSKELLNSIYGMMVTDIAPDEVLYENGCWTKESTNLHEALSQYNNKKTRFLFYPWGIYVTAYARRNLFTGIYNFNSDYVYSDTDSIKALNFEKHKEYVEMYNEDCKRKSKASTDFHNLPNELTYPTDKKGKPRYLGIWDYEGTYDRFKTLGAKRYLVEKDGEIELTVSGVNKHEAVPYLESLKKDVFESFNEDCIIPKGYCGKKTLTYIDEEIRGKVKDYLGNYYSFYEKSCIHMEDASYSFSLSTQYVEYLKGVREEKYAH